MSAPILARYNDRACAPLDDPPSRPSSSLPSHARRRGPHDRRRRVDRRENLTLVAERFSIGGCGGDPELDDSALASIDALANLETVGRFEITDQSALVGLDGLATALAVDWLAIRHNAMLPEAEALAFMDAVMPVEYASVCGNAGGMPCVDESCPPTPD